MPGGLGSDRFEGDFVSERFELSDEASGCASRSRRRARAGCRSGRRSRVSIWARGCSARVAIRKLGRGLLRVLGRGAVEFPGPELGYLPMCGPAGGTSMASIGKGPALPAMRALCGGVWRRRGRCGLDLRGWSSPVVSGDQSWFRCGAAVGRRLVAPVVTARCAGLAVPAVARAAAQRAWVRPCGSLGPGSAVRARCLTA